MDVAWEGGGPGKGRPGPVEGTASVRVLEASSTILNFVNEMTGG